MKSPKKNKVAKKSGVAKKKMKPILELELKLASQLES